LGKEPLDPVVRVRAKIKYGLPSPVARMITSLDFWNSRSVSFCFHCCQAISTNSFGKPLFVTLCPLLSESAATLGPAEVSQEATRSSANQPLSRACSQAGYRSEFVAQYIRGTKHVEQQARSNFILKTKAAPPVSDTGAFALGDDLVVGLLIISGDYAFVQPLLKLCAC